jgi:RNA ligase
MSRQDVDERDVMAAYGYLRFADHGDLRVYTYTDRCIRQNFWNDITLNSRGHIFNVKTSECIARPFPRMFNLNELPGQDESTLPWDQVDTITEKVDGWLGIHYRHADLHCIATRGHFCTEAGLWATGELQGHALDALPATASLVFEIVHPLSRVVVDYGDRQELVLLAAFDRFTGAEFPREQVAAWADQFGFRVVPAITGHGQADVVAALQNIEQAGGEGLVVRFKDGTRVKIKVPEYMDRFKAMWSERSRGPRQSGMLEA